MPDGVKWCFVHRQFRQVDVFTEEPFLGNPVAVVHGADDLTDEQMRRFASWTNLSETTFLLAPSDERADYRVRIFTPERELPFAGHPTLGSAHAWLESGGPPARQDMLIQECGAGLITIRRSPHGHLAFEAPPLIRSGPVDEPLLDEIAEALGIKRADIVDAQWADNGPGWVAVELASAEAVLALAPPVTSHDIGVFGPYPPGSPEAIEVRAFTPLIGGTGEDPVTGSLNASLAMWLLPAGKVTAPYTASQGTALGRRGRIHVAADADGTIWIGGGTHTLISGSVHL
ncbi:MAG TPA: PhzF family phenazine biosynthesis protein [Trebonia sp.]|nr:PhzF family phenazine biosynthesis protein [Trebonia sp.]